MKIVENYTFVKKIKRVQKSWKNATCGVNRSWGTTACSPTLNFSLYGEGKFLSGKSLKFHFVFWGQYVQFFFFFAISDLGGRSFEPQVKVARVVVYIQKTKTFSFGVSWSSLDFHIKRTRHDLPSRRVYQLSKNLSGFLTKNMLHASPSIFYLFRNLHLRQIACWAHNKFPKEIPSSSSSSFPSFNFGWSQGW